MAIAIMGLSGPCMSAEDLCLIALRAMIQNDLWRVSVAARNSLDAPHALPLLPLAKFRLVYGRRPEVGPVIAYKKGDRDRDAYPNYPFDSLVSAIMKVEELGGQVFESPTG